MMYKTNLDCTRGFENITINLGAGESGSASAVYLIETATFKASENQSRRLLLAIDNLITATDGFASIDDLVGGHYQQL